MFQKSQKIIYILTIFNALRMLVGAISSIYLLTHGIDLLTLGFLKSLQSLIFFTLDIPSSYLADKYSRKGAIILSFFLCSLWLLITSIAKSNTAFFIAEIFNALSLTILGGVANAYIFDNSQDHEKTKTIFHSLNKLQFFFMAISSLIGAILYNFNPSLLWVLAGSAILLFTIFASYFLPSGVVQKKTSHTSIIQALKTLKNCPKFIIIKAINLALLLSAFQILLQFWQPIIQPYFSISLAGLSFGIIFSLILAAQSLCSYVYQRVKNSKSISLGFDIFAIIIPLLMVELSFLKEKELYIILLILLFGILQTVITTERTSYHYLINSNNRSLYESVTITLSKLICLILLPLSSYLAQTFNWSIILLLISAIGAINIYTNSKLNKTFIV